ncbi:MAG: A24 family peptidase [Ardenticatenia bacterium]|nr:A24 family peptidase [Ardenticatenia bacterium]
MNELNALWLPLLVGLAVGFGLNPLVDTLPTFRRSSLPADNGVYVRLQRRPCWLALLNGVAYTLAWWKFPSPVEALAVSLYSSVLLLILIVDLETRLIPHVLIYPATFIALIGSTVDPRLTPQSALLGGVVGFVIFYAVAWLTRGGIGWGDVNLAAFVGCITGFPDVLTGLTVGILLGGLISLGLLVSRRVPRNTFIPYGPFLCLGGWYAMMWG